MEETGLFAARTSTKDPVSACDSECNRAAVIGFDHGERPGPRFRMGASIYTGMDR
jgi:hypothetical protein